MKLKCSLFILGLTSFFAHLPLIGVGLELLHSDYAPGCLVANAFRQGHWSAFYFDLPYGGTTLAPFRALFTALWEFFSHSEFSWIKSQMAFSFGFLPMTLSIASFLLVRTCCGFGASFLTGIVAALGFSSWVNQYGNDIYIAYLLLGFLLLGWRIKRGDPWKNLNFKSLLLAGTLSGLSFYTSRISLIFILSFWIPWSKGVIYIKRLIKPKDQIENLLLYFLFVFSFLFVYLQIFGTDLGTINGKNLKLHGAPNLHYFLCSLFFYGLKILWREKRILDFLKNKLMPIASGFIIGFSPEWIHWLKLGQIPPVGMGNGLSNYQTFLEAVSKAPFSLRELVAGGKEASWNASVLLAGVSFYFLWRKRNKTLPILGSSLITLVAYASIHTYVFAPARYLLPVFPALLVGMGCFFEEVLSQKKILWLILIPILGLHGIHQWTLRAQTVTFAQTSIVSSRIFEIIRLFQAHHVKVVLSDDYWHSNQYSFMSALNPVFTAPDAPGLHPPQANALIHSESRVGILLHQNLLPGKTESNLFLDPETSIAGKRWHLEKIATVGDRDLFIGTLL